MKIEKYNNFTGNKSNTESDTGVSKSKMKS